MCYDKLFPVDVLGELQYDIGISCHYRHIIRRDELDCFKYGVINIHPSMLPYGRGSDPIIWSMIHNVPTGITCHWIDEGIDTGNILFQLEIPRNELETAQELYQRITGYYRYIFPVVWDELYQKLRKGIRPDGKKQKLRDSPFHAAHKRSDLKRLGDLTGSQDLRLLLAMTHSKHNNLYAIDENGDRYNVIVRIEKQQ